MKEDFQELLKEAEKKPMTIRLLDSPLYEFMPKTDEEIRKLAKRVKISEEEIRKQIEVLKEANLVLGHRGVRLEISYPDITRMQIRAIIKAVIERVKQGEEVIPEIMIPLVSHVNELKVLKEIIDNAANEVMQEEGLNIKYLVGAMIETPRASLIADQLAKEIDLLYFGTNGLTQMGYGFSREDLRRFMVNT